MQAPLGSLAILGEDTHIIHYIREPMSGAVGHLFAGGNPPPQRDVRAAAASSWVGA